MRPATAWFPMPTTLARKAGATEVNSPVTEKPANAARAAVTNTPRTCGGTESRWKPIAPDLLEVSGTTSTATAASTTSTMCTTKVSCSGAGAYCASTPARTGPAPSPPMLATVATAGARSRQFGGAASITAAVPVPVNRPADRPDSTRPTSSSGTESATRNTSGAGQCACDAGQQHRTSAHRVGPPAEGQQGQQHPAGVTGVDDRGGEHLEMHALGVQRVQRGGQCGARP